MKTLIVIHRALREVDPTFHEELINYGRSRSHMLNLAHFKDDSSPNGSFLFPNTVSFLKSFFYQKTEFLVMEFVFAASMGLFCLGPFLCLIFGGEAGVLSCSEIRCGDRSCGNKIIFHL